MHDSIIPNNAEIVLELDRISYAYGADEVVHDISFSVYRGDYLGIVGPNGAGKTTLLKIVLGLIKPDKGTIRFFGVPQERFNAWHKIGYVAQKATSFDSSFPATVGEVVLMGTYPRRGIMRRTTREDRTAADFALSRVGMEEYKDRLIGDLSGGQQQQVFIARALAGKPEILFLDEPTVGVDQQSREEFYALLRRLNTEFSLTLVLVSHDIDVVAREANCIACVDRGLVCHGTPEQFLADTSLRGRFGDVKIMTHTHNHSA